MLEKIAAEKNLIKKIREKCIKTSNPGVSIITATNKYKYMDNIFMNYKAFNYPCKQLIIVLNNNNLDIKSYEIRVGNLSNVEIFQLDENITLGECLNFAAEKSKYDYISKMDDDDYYGSNYLIDLMNAFKYTDAQVIGKASRFIYFKDSNKLGVLSPGHENKYVYEDIAGGTITLKKEILKKVKFKNFNNSEDTTFLRECNSCGIRMFSSDKFNYVYIKHENLNEHTWKISANEIRKYCSEYFLFTKDFTKFVTI
ncbi:glycosyl transferase family 2 [Clostridium ragsdalei P11]|uniref:Glycosyl transferase family 2 n=1 Tax=Clostridium ragsdalei P11 TaxID=1353534 RepID=A0A1A6AI63_9CLOT|nr:glycosyltransferase family A protein [Clostridium ragsdalei]OBR89759.1 glycosyl transferase family 2 [Clostridium ragsdalei P11]